MFSAVSFGSTYKVNNRDPEAFSKFHQFVMMEKKANCGIKSNYKDTTVRNGDTWRFDYIAEETLIAPDYMDIDIEKFCLRKGIRYKKFETKDLLNPETIGSRAKDAPSGYKKVYINPEKFEKLIKRQVHNIDFCEDNYYDYYSKEIEKMLRDGDKYTTTTLNFNSSNGNIDELNDYIKNFGTDNLNDNQIIAVFTQETDAPDHCVYYALKNLGVKQIPIYVNTDSYKIGKNLGLF